MSILFSFVIIVRDNSNLTAVSDFNNLLYNSMSNCVGFALTCHCRRNTFSRGFSWDLNFAGLLQFTFQSSLLIVEATIVDFVEQRC